MERVREAKRDLEDAEMLGRDAKETFKKIGDPDGVKKAESVEKEARKAVEYIEERTKDSG